MDWDHLAEGRVTAADFVLTWLGWSSAPLGPRLLAGRTLRRSGSIAHRVDPLPLPGAIGTRVVAWAAAGLVGALVAGLVGFGGVAPASVDPPALEPGEGPGPREAVTFSGRVIEKETGRPVAGAEVVVTRSLVTPVGGGAPPWLGDSSLRTDPEGWFAIAFPPEQVAEPRLALTIARVAHPDFVPRKGFRTPLTALLRQRRYGEKPDFETVTLERGAEYTGLVVTPDGRPAAGVPFWFENWGWGGNPSRHFSDENEGRTDGEGRFRLRMTQTHALAIRLTPGAYAPYQRFWGTDVRAGNAEIRVRWVPGDLGRLVLEPGPVLSGRLLDLRGRPLAGRALTAFGRVNRSSRTATTDAEGRFAFAPLRPGNYAVYGAGQDMYGGVDPARPPMSPDAPVIRPVPVFLEAGVAPGPLELHEVATVRVAVRFVDSLGRPSRGAPVKLWGILPGGKGEADPFDTGLPGMNLASSINDPEPRVSGGRVDWGAQLVPDADGLATFRAPKGLKDAELSTYPLDETVAFKTRLGLSEPLKYWGRGVLGDLDADREGIEVAVYRAPTVLIRIATEGGEPVQDDAKPSVGFNVRGGDYGGNEIRLGDGRFRTQSLMPDHEYELRAWARGYVPSRVERLSLPEGVEAELTLVMRKKPKTPAVGDPAPPFAVGTLQGDLRTLDDFRGRVLLLHVWTPYFRDDRDLPRLDAIRKRYGEDQLAMLGLSLSVDPDASRKALAAWNIAWPQAVLRDRGAHPMILDYDGLWPPKSFLIGPDGTILARDLEGEKVDDAVAAALGGR